MNRSNTAEATLSWSNRPVYDTLLAALLAFAHAALAAKWGGVNPWQGVDTASRLVIFQTGAGVITLASGLAAISISVGAIGERGRAVRELHGKELRANRRSLLIMSAVAAGLCLVGMLATARNEDWGVYLFEFAVAWTLIRMARLTWFVDALMAIDDFDATKIVRTDPVRVSNDFRARMAPLAEAKEDDS